MMKTDNEERYENNELSEEAIAFVEENIHFTPTEIHSKLIKSGLPKSDDAKEHQIYYRWQQANARFWHLDENSFESCRKYLDEKLTEELLQYMRRLLLCHYETILDRQNWQAVPS